MQIVKASIAYTSSGELSMKWILAVVGQSTATGCPPRCANRPITSQSKATTNPRPPPSAEPSRQTECGWARLAHPPKIVVAPRSHTQYPGPKPPVVPRNSSEQTRNTIIMQIHHRGQNIDSSRCKPCTVIEDTINTGHVTFETNGDPYNSRHDTMADMRQPPGRDSSEQAGQKRDHLEHDTTIDAESVK